MKTDYYGDSTWTKTIDYQGHDVGRSIKQLTDGNYILSANDGPDGYDNLLTFKLNNSGETIWVKNYGGDASYTPFSIISTFDEGILTTGRIWQQSGMRGIFVYNQNQNGDSLWFKTFEQGATGSGQEVIQTNDAGYTICGSVNFNGSGSIADSWIIKLEI